MRVRVTWRGAAVAMLGAWQGLGCGVSSNAAGDYHPPTDAGFEVSIPQCTDVDSDSDSVSDPLESSGSVDTDQDGTPDTLDTDSDGDGWTDEQEAGSKAFVRPSVCSALLDSDADGLPDLRDLDSDDDGVPDADERSYDSDGSRGCFRVSDCDNDGVIDLIELAAGSNPTDASSMPTDATLYFVIPFGDSEKSKEFTFSSGVKRADVYFLIDTTSSMQAAIDNVGKSIDSTIIPTLLNGSATSVPPIPSIPGAWVGVGEARDIPWAPYGEEGDCVYRNAFRLKGAGEPATLGNVAAPESQGIGFKAPSAVRDILGSLKAGGGGDASEAMSQALWAASTGQVYAATLGGYWKSEPRACANDSLIGTPCFRPGAIPVFVVVTDASFHNGPSATRDYDTSGTGGTKSYKETIDALVGIGAKVVGVPVNTGTPGVARIDLSDLAMKTGSTYYDPGFGGAERALVSTEDTSSGKVSTEVVRLLGLLSGQGVNNVTTSRGNYSCSGGVDCTGDGVVDPVYYNPIMPGESEAFDASKLISRIEPVSETTPPLPYSGIDSTTFYGVRGDAKLRFRVVARNKIVNPEVLTVVKAKVQVQTPKGQLLGGEQGVKVVYLVIPRRQVVIK